MAWAITWPSRPETAVREKLSLATMALSSPLPPSPGYWGMVTLIGTTAPSPGPSGPTLTGPPVSQALPEKSCISPQNVIE
jgi:hypothetical protein